MITQTAILGDGGGLSAFADLPHLSMFSPVLATLDVSGSFEYGPFPVQKLK